MGRVAKTVIFNDMPYKEAALGAHSITLEVECSELADQLTASELRGLLRAIYHKRPSEFEALVADAMKELPPQSAKVETDAGSRNP